MKKQMFLLHFYKTSSKDILENEGHAVSSDDMPLLLYSSFTTSQSKMPLPSSSSSMPKPTTSRLSSLKGSRYWRS